MQRYQLYKGQKHLNYTMQPRLSRPLRLSGITSRLYTLGQTTRGQRAAQRPFSSSTIFSSSSTSSPSSSPSSPSSSPSNARWIDDLRLRIGKCITFGCDAAQVSRSARVLAAISAEWRDLLAGSHGFVTPGSLDPGSPLAVASADKKGGDGDGNGARGNTKMGLLNHAVAWGDMDSFVSLCLHAFSPAVCWDNYSTASMRPLQKMMRGMVRMSFASTPDSQPSI